MRKLLYLLVAVTLFAACREKNANREENVNTPSSDALPPESGIQTNGDMYLYVTTVDKLLMREKPTRNSRALSKLAEGAFVWGENEVSENREEVVLRDIPYNTPFYKVQAMDNPDQKGWAYGGGLKCIYTGKAADRPELGSLSRLSKFIATLDSRKLDSGGRLWSFIRKNFNDARGSEADAAFIMVEHFFRRMDLEGEYYTQIETIDWTHEDYDAIVDDRFNMNKYPKTRLLAENGFRLEMAEGYVFPIFDWSLLNDFFGEKSTAPMKDYITQRLEEQLTQETSDGAIIIPLEDLAKRAIFWEKFNARNPGFPLFEETRDSERFSWEVLLSGTDNTPAFDFNSKEVTPEFRNMWEFVIKNYPGTNVAKRIKGVRDLCASEGWKYTPKVEKYLTELLGYQAFYM